MAPNYRFGLFHYQRDADGDKLLCRGLPTGLQGHPLQVLSCLLDRHGEIVSREDLCQLLWPQGTFVEFEGGLNAAVRRLRAQLHDSAESPVFIETVPKRGYRFIAPVEVETGAEVKVAAPPPRPLPAKRRWKYGLAGALALAAVLAVAVSLPPPAAPRVVRVRQISSFGIANPRIVTDGTRIYVSGREALDQPFQVYSVEGGEGLPFQVPLPGAESIEGASPDGAWLLVTLNQGTARPMWKVPLPAGSPQRLGDAQGADGVWSPDGTQIAYTNGSDLDLIAASGGAARRLASWQATVAYPVWSPDGKRIRLTVLPYDRDPSQTESLWEVDVASGARRPVFSHFRSLSTHALGWTPDGAYFIFTSERAGVCELWAAPERHDWLTWRQPQPVRLTSGPISFNFPVLARSGRTIFAVGIQRRAQLLRFDRRSYQFVPFLGGVAADQVSFSRDGQWAAYVSYPGQTLWRSRSDGSQRVQLTFAPMLALEPRWSPDGRWISFEGVDQSGRATGYLVSKDGGSTRALVAAGKESDMSFTWLPDGRHLLYTAWLGLPGSPATVRRLDLQTGETTPEPALSGFALASPDGRYIAVQAWTTKQLSLVDTSTGQRRVIAASGDYPFWSPDSSALFFNTLNDFPLGPHSGLQRYSLATRRTEPVLERPDFGLTGTWGAWVGLAPDGSPLVLRDETIRALYALDLEEH